MRNGKKGGFEGQGSEVNVAVIHVDYRGSNVVLPAFCETGEGWSLSGRGREESIIELCCIGERKFATAGEPSY